MPKKHVGTARTLTPGVAHGHPRNEYDYKAWYRVGDGRCPRGTHRAPKYDHIHDSATHCVRQCDQWNPERRRAKKGGACYIKSAWLEMLQDYRETFADEINALQGKAKADYMKDLMKEAGRVYRRYFVPGKTTLRDYQARKPEIFGHMDKNYAIPRSE